jgi:PTH1 family peptidyl-tRNA hydrolase
VDLLASRHSIPVRRLFCRAMVGGGAVCGSRVLLAKPVTFMNLSGQSVAGIARYYGLDAACIWVAVDDAALPLGRLRLRLQGSSGGHNGLASIESHLGTRLYPRVRVGIGSADRGDLVDHVLSRFRPAEERAAEEAIALAADSVEMGLSEGFEAAMNRFNGLQGPDAGIVGPGGG